MARQKTRTHVPDEEFELAVTQFSELSCKIPFVPTPEKEVRLMEQLLGLEVGALEVSTDAGASVRVCTGSNDHFSGGYGIRVRTLQDPAGEYGENTLLHTPVRAPVELPKNPVEKASYGGPCVSPAGARTGVRKILNVNLNLRGSVGVDASPGPRGMPHVYSNTSLTLYFMATDRGVYYYTNVRREYTTILT
eukprot:scaffold219257_cov19-Tisochrysis_lutea.AAC.1